VSDLKTRFIVNEMIESTSSYLLELVPKRDEKSSDPNTIYSGYPVGLIRLSPVKKEVTDILDVGMEVEVTFTPIEKAKP
jgi:hypothetical protein